MVEHVSIIDADRHEPKHASTALTNQVLKSIGSGQTNFAFVDYSELLSKPTSAGYRTTLAAFSTGNQTPSALDTPLQINFGSPQSNANVSIDASGTLTFLTAGDYAVSLILRYGRSAGGGTATLLTRYLVNNVQNLNTNTTTLPDATSVTPFSITLYVTAVINDTFKLQIMRDSSGANLGGLTSLVPALAGWNVSPSATLVVSKFTGLI